MFNKLKALHLMYLRMRPRRNGRLLLGGALHDS